MLSFLKDCLPLLILRNAYWWQRFHCSLVTKNLSTLSSSLIVILILLCFFKFSIDEKVGTLFKYNNYIRVPGNEKGKIKLGTLAYYRSTGVVFWFYCIALFCLTSSWRSQSEHIKCTSPCGAARRVIQFYSLNMCVVQSMTENQMNGVWLACSLIGCTFLFH